MGPIIQFCISDSARTRQLRKNLGSSSYLTFASGGNIMRISPTAIGIDVVPIESLVTASPTWGTKYPNPTPNPIAMNIHNVRNLSRNAKRGVLQDCSFIFPSFPSPIWRLWFLSRRVFSLPAQSVYPLGLPTPSPQF